MLNLIFFRRYSHAAKLKEGSHTKNWQSVIFDLRKHDFIYCSGSKFQKHLTNFLDCTFKIDKSTGETDKTRLEDVDNS